jgi:hypothetical protein
VVHLFGLYTNINNLLALLMVEPIDREQLSEDLLAYCHLDTLAMVKIWERVEGMGL